MALLKYFLLISLCSTFAFADETKSAPEAPQPEPKFEAHTHRFSNGFTTSPYNGIYFSYSQPIESQWTLGVRVSSVQQSEDKKGGDLDAAQYYEEENEENISMAEINATFYFRENGHGRWGPFIRGGLGYAQHKMKTEWNRYDRDPGFFNFGDDKRLRESKDFEKNWSSPFARLGAHYQFAWRFHSNASAGHILELGVTGLYYGNKKTTGYTRPDGKSSSFSSVPAAVSGEISYTIAF